MNQEFYDFMEDHGPGGSSHADGVIRRYLNAVVVREPEIPGHLELDPATGLLYVADTGNGRIMTLDTASGSSNGDLPNNWDNASECDAESGELIAYELDGTEIGRVATSATRIMGITFGPDGLLYSFCARMHGHRS